MKPILYVSTEKTFTGNGVGVLSDAASCTVTEERNGSFELTMQYPVMGIHYGDITYRSLIMAKPSPDGAAQPFRVYRITRPLGGLVTVYAEHISYDLSGVTMPPFSAQGLAGAFSAITANAIPSGNGFAYWTDKASSASVSSTVPISVRSLLGGVQGSILDVYGGEYEFDRFTVKLWAKRGADRGVTIRYGKNLTTLEQDASCAAVYTAVYPYWTSEDVTVELPEKTVAVTGTFDFTRILPLDLSTAFEEQPTTDQLRTAAQYYIADNKVGVPTVSLSLSFAQLDGETVNLCDTVEVTFAALGISTHAKVVKTTFDVLRDRYESVELGTIRASVADTIAGQTMEIGNLPTTQAMQKAILNATAWITGTGGGYVIFKRNDAGQPTELLIMDSPDMAAAVNVWRWNLGGLGFSRSGVNGPYETAITQDGAIVGKFVTAEGLHVYSANIDGKLTASQIDATDLQVKAANITGTLTASQIDATDLQVKAANITGTLTASQIDATDLEVSAANITGTLTASQIDATNLHVDGANIDNLVVKNAEIESLSCSKLTGYMPSGRISDSTHELSELFVGDLTATEFSTTSITVPIIYVGSPVGSVAATINTVGIKYGGTQYSWDTIVSGGGAVFG